MFFRIFQNNDNQAIKQSAGALNDIQMPQCNRIEASGGRLSFHAPSSIIRYAGNSIGDILYLMQSTYLIRKFILLQTLTDDISQLIHQIMRIEILQNMQNLSLVMGIQIMIKGSLCSCEALAST